MSLTLPIVIGKRYVRRDGRLATARVTANRTVAAFSRVDDDHESCDAVYLETGKFCIDPTKTHHADLVADYVESTGHAHAASMALYAQDAAETAEPWLRWQCRNGPLRPWTDHGMQPAWFPDCEYRRKPRTIRIGAFDVPEPLREAPPMRTEYFAPHITARFIGTCVWTDGEWDHLVLNRGLVHLTREAAELHARALISLTEQTR